MPTHRMAQVDEVLRRTLAGLLERELEFPPGVVVTVTRVQTAADFSTAKVWVSVLPAEQSAAALKRLTAALPELQRLVAAASAFQFMPRLKLMRDASEERAARIMKLLDELRGHQA